MICYFTGTGNSAYAASRIAGQTEQEVLNLFEKIRSQDHTALHSEKPWVIVCPTYAWRIPRILSTWLKQTPLTGSRDLYFVMTCGGSIGNAEVYLKKLCRQKQMNFCGCFPIVIPENYLALFTTPTQDEALECIRKSEPWIDQAAQEIRQEVPFSSIQAEAKDKLNSGIVNVLFYPMMVSAKKFTVTDACIHCGLCAKVCPLNNIQLRQGQPQWGKNCTHCMACICRCPKEAIEYGTHSVGLPRYTCPL
ncbi:EFR1 family ferrodoxin [Holdemania massiliensis]|uniref:EFR1 family ferrodoxin n=1 Tax=Holdemania massiliensis TaxID=1468449 RepID=UPI0035615DAC